MGELRLYHRANKTLSIIEVLPSHITTHDISGLVINFEDKPKPQGDRTKTKFVQRPLDAVAIWR